MINEDTVEEKAVNQSLIVIEQLSKVYMSRKSSFEALRDINLHIERNEFLSIIGPSGCGKSTLLRIIAGLEEATDGEISVDDIQVIGPGADRGMVFQGYTLFPWLTVRQNIEYGLKLRDVPMMERRAISSHYLKLIKLESFANALPKQLSGGMKQRVAIARALANRPKVLLMDEPFGALDAQTKVDMQEMLLEVWEKEKTTVIFITHDIDEAVYLSQRIVVMAAHPGRIIADHQVAMDYPRSVIVRESAEFLSLKRKCSMLLKHEAAKS